MEIWLLSIGSAAVAKIGQEDIIEMLSHLLALSTIIVLVAGHGRLLDPPSRASIWRFNANAKPNYDDAGLNCGGVYRQHVRNRGKCGICGDPYDMKEPRPHEIGGTFGKGIIAAKYKAEQILPITVEITAFHQGYWTFKICPNPKSTSQSCFDKYPLELVNGDMKFYPPTQGKHIVKYRLPKGLYCEHCVLQWRYIAGNSWGDCDNGTSQLGCGSQETFGACSDISISAPNFIQGGSMPTHVAYSGNVDKDLLDFLRKMTRKTIKKKPNKPSIKHKNKHKKKSNRKPRERQTKHSKRKKVFFWE
ncbi:unnamed protein product, partial [Brenthis ino]